MSDVDRLQRTYAPFYRAVQDAQNALVDNPGSEEAFDARERAIEALSEQVESTLTALVALARETSDVAEITRIRELSTLINSDLDFLAETDPLLVNRFAFARAVDEEIRELLDE